MNTNTFGAMLLLASIGLCGLAASAIYASPQNSVTLNDGKMVTLLAAKNTAPFVDNRPDLFIRRAEPLSNGIPQLRVQVANGGGAASPSCTLLISYAQSSLIRLRTIFVPSIGAGCSRWLHIDLETEGAVSSPLHLSIDKDDRVEEADEKNNHLIVNSHTRPSW